MRVCQFRHFGTWRAARERPRIEEGNASFYRAGGLAANGPHATRGASDMSLACMVTATWRAAARAVTTRSAPRTTSPAA